MFLQRLSRLKRDRLPLTYTAISVVVICFIHAVQAQAETQDMEEVVILESYIPDEKLETSEVAELIDADTMSIAGDSNIGDALKRLPGLSLVGGKFIYVRGLGERYSATYFNGTLMPGIEPLKRAVPLDLFDTSVTSNVLVQKTYSANYGGEFSGGVVDIRSAALPNENFFKIQYSTASNTHSTGEQGFGYSGGSNDWFGYDDGTRDIPGLIQQNLSLYPNLFGSADQGINDILKRDAARFSFDNNVWQVRQDKVPMDQGVSIGFGRRQGFGADFSAGLVAVFTLDNKTRNRFTERSRWGGGAFDDGFYESDAQAKLLRDNALEFGDNKVTPSDANDAFSLARLSSVTNYDRTVEEINATGLVSLGVEFRDVHSLKFTNMLLRKTSDEASIRDARVSSTTSNVLRRTTRLEWVENQIRFQQLSGEHWLTAAKINWRVSSVDGSRDVPDAREYTLAKDNNNTTATAGRFGLPTSFIASNGFPVREYTYLDDKADEYGFDLEVPLSRNTRYLNEMTLKIGVSSFDKERSYQAFRFAFDIDLLENSSILPLADRKYDPVFFDNSVEQLLDASTCVPGGDDADDDLCYLAENDNGGSAFLGTGNSSNNSIDIRAGFQTGRPDSYTGSMGLDARYVSLDMKATDWLRANIGIRQETSSQKVTPQSSAGSIFESVNLDATYALPAASLTWDLGGNKQLRVAYSETINRPILRELSEVRVYNPDDGEQYRGNPDLKIAEITNVDLRFEWYFGEADYLSLSAFSKSIKDPIELNREDIGDGNVLTWLNIDKATNEGLEFEIRKYFGEQWFITANASYIDSETEGDPNTLVLEDTNRPLQGLSRELYNLQVVYETDLNTTSLSWNKFSRRIFAISNVAGEIYEEPFQSLNLNTKFRFLFSKNELVLGFKASNLLDESAEFVYKNGLPYDNYEVGTTYSVSLEWKNFP